MKEAEFINIFSGNLKRLIDESGITIQELSIRSTVNKSTIHRYLRKERFPTTVSVVNLSLALRCRIDDLIPTYDYLE